MGQPAACICHPDTRVVSRAEVQACCLGVTAALRGALAGKEALPQPQQPKGDAGEASPASSSLLWTIFLFLSGFFARGVSLFLLPPQRFVEKSPFERGSGPCQVGSLHTSLLASAAFLPRWGRGVGLGEADGW